MLTRSLENSAYLILFLKLQITWLIEISKTQLKNAPDFTGNFHINIFSIIFCDRTHTGQSR